MNWLLKSSDIQERARDLSRTNLLFIFGIIKAASIGVGVSVFMQVFFNLGETWKWIRIAEELPKFLHWGVSYLCLIVTFDSAMFATLFLVHIPKKSESFWTFLLVGLETLQFAFLSPSIINRDTVKQVMSVDVFGWWYAVFFFYSLSMGMLVFFTRNEIRESSAIFEASLKPVITQYLHSFGSALLMITLAGIFSSVVFWFHFFSQGNQSLQYWIQMIASSGLLCLTWVFFVYQHKQRDIIEKLIASIHS
jgi:hypothetical protein